MAGKKNQEKNTDSESNQTEKPVHAAVVDKITQSVVTGLGLVTALAWNEAIQAVFNRFSSKPAGIAAKFIYAVVLTVIIVIITLQLTRIAKKIKKALYIYVKVVKVTVK